MNVKVFNVYLNTKNINSIMIRLETIWLIIFIEDRQLTF